MSAPVASRTPLSPQVGRSASIAQLVDKARRAESSLREQHDAFAQLVERSQHLVFTWALASLRNVEEARDAAQDAFAAAWLGLPRLRDAAAFTAWLRKIVETQCHRRLRRKAAEPAPPEAKGSVEADVMRAERRSLVASALSGLPAGERQVTVLYYFLGHTQAEIARLLRLKQGTVGKRLHSARLRIRRRLPASVRREFVRLESTSCFVERVRLGIFDEYVGEYRFDRRPDHVVVITRQGDCLVSEAAGQRHLLASPGGESLFTIQYDGEGRFRRDRRGKVTHFVYYEFGRRLGIARKAPPRPSCLPP